MGVVDTISANIAAVFDKSHSTFEFNYGDHSLAFGRRIDYLDVLMENFDLGELALKRQLPVGNVSATPAIFSITLFPPHCCSVEVLCAEYFHIEPL